MFKLTETKTLLRGVFTAILLFACAVAQAEAKINPDCRFQGKKLFGKVKIVESFPDLKVKVVSSFPDLKVKWVQSFPERCGLWQPEESFPDLKIQFVENFPDLKVMFVDSFPGLP